MDSFQPKPLFHATCVYARVPKVWMPPVFKRGQTKHAIIFAAFCHENWNESLSCWNIRRRINIRNRTLLSDFLLAHIISVTSNKTSTAKTIQIIWCFSLKPYIGFLCTPESNTNLYLPSCPWSCPSLLLHSYPSYISPPITFTLLVPLLSFDLFLCCPLCLELPPRISIWIPALLLFPPQSYSCPSLSTCKYAK